MSQETRERPRPAMRNPENDEFPTGPAVGDLLPEFTLLDQRGESVTVSVAGTKNTVYLVFIRATVW